MLTVVKVSLYWREVEPVDLFCLRRDLDLKMKFETSNQCNDKIMMDKCFLNVTNLINDIFFGRSPQKLTNDIVERCRIAVAVRAIK